MMNQRYTFKPIFGTILLIAAVMAVAVIAGGQYAQAQDESEELVVGTYDIQQVFQRHPAQTKLQELESTTQAEIQKAQQAGNVQKTQQLQQQYEQQRGQIIWDFQTKVNQIIEEAAKSADVKVVASEFAYIAEDVTEKDITPDLVKVMAKERSQKAEQKSNIPAMPQGFTDQQQ